MKKIGMMLMMLFLTSLTFGQNLTVRQFIDLSKKSLGEVEQEITANNWHFFQGVDETEETFGNAKFVYDRPNFKTGDVGQFFITYYYSQDDSANAIDISFRNKQVYESFMNQLDTLKFKLKSSKTVDGNIIKVFKRGAYITEVTYPPNFEKSNSFKFLFAKKAHYKKISR
jgi:hypothetical protein